MDLTIDQAKGLATKLLQQGQLQDLNEIIRKLLLARPNDAEVILLAAKYEFYKGSPTIARSLLHKANVAAPDLIDVKTAIAEFESLDRNLAGHEYRNSHLLLRSLHADYPVFIQLETVGRCNAKCSFCPHSELSRKFDAMSDDLFEKIVNDASAIPSHSPLSFILNGVNETFMDKKIFSRMRMLNERIPHATLYIYTTMNVMPIDFFKNLANIKRIAYWNVSLNVANESEYESLMGIKFNRTIRNLKRFLDENRKHKYIEKPIVISRVATEDEADERFINECMTLFAEYKHNEEYKPVCKNRAEWLGHTQSVGGSNRQILMPCSQWFNIGIQCNGLVAHCNMDAKGEFPFGDVNKESILDIYNSPRFKNLRQNVISRDVIYPCNTCSLY